MDNKMKFSKKIIILTMACTVLYAIAYMVLCFRTGQLPDYSFNAGIFAALTAENGFNAWIKTCEKAGAAAITANELNEEHELPMETEDEEDSFIPYEQEEEEDSDNG